MNRYLCMFAHGEQYINVLVQQNELMKDKFKTIFNYTSDWLEDSGFYNLNNARYILENSNTGHGFASWKPYLILKTMEHINDGDILYYMDVVDYVYNPNFYPWVEKLIETELKESFFNINYYRHGDWTTKKCQELMGCDTPFFYNQRQLECGTFALIKNKQNIELMEEWLKWCLVPDAILKNRNPKEENDPGFIDHRTDQSILTNLFYQHELKGIGMEYVRAYIAYNYFEKDMTGYAKEKHRYD